MSKIKQTKIPMTLTEDVILKIAVDQGVIENKFNWKLIREHDGLTNQSKDIMWIEWNEDGTFKEKYDTFVIGRSLLMSPFNQFFTWQTTPVTEIVEEQDDYIKFKTQNSNYELWKLKKKFMKTLLTLLFILPFFMFSQKSVIGKTYNLNGLEIAQFDFLEPMTYDVAVKECLKLGSGWRLPTKEEMEEIYKNKNILGGFVSPIYAEDNSEFYIDKNVYYWSGSSYGSDYVWVIGFTNKFVGVTLKTGYLYARAVKK